MPTVYNNIDKVAGNPNDSIVVSIELIWDTTESVIAKVISEETVVNGTHGTETDDDGNWSVSNIVSNDDITPSGSLYKVTERDSSNNTVIYYIDVPDAATPTSWVGDIIVETADLPTWVA